VVEDCLRLLLNLLRNNPSNQTFFKEGSYISRLLMALSDSGNFPAFVISSVADP
jgi:hypothetical protein